MHQFALENPAWSALRFDKQLKTYFKEGVVVQGCTYGGRIAGKEYLLWMEAETLDAFWEPQIMPGLTAKHARQRCCTDRQCARRRATNGDRRA